MSKNYHLAVFTVLMAALWGLMWWHTGRLIPPSGQDAIWFNGGLFALLLGKFVTEYRFAKPNDVFLNCVAVFVTVSTLSNPPYPEWWQMLRISAVLIGMAAMVLAWDPGQEAKLLKHPLRSIAYQLVTSLGRSEVIFSATFILALLSYFKLNDPHTRVLVLSWGIFLLAANLNLPAIGRVAFMKRSKDRRIIGVVHSFIAPSIVFCRKIDPQKVKLHQLVGFAQSVSGNCQCLGLVIGERSSASETRLAIAMLKCGVEDVTLNDKTIVMTIGEAERHKFDPTLSDADLNQLKKFVGTVTKGTNISQVKFEVFGSPAIAAGSLLRVISSSRAVFYQVFDGLIEEEKTVHDSSRAFVEGLGEQVGFWDNNRGGFETYDWVAKERAQVNLIDELDDTPVYNLKDRELAVGRIPNSSYPVNINIDDLVLYHSAILGVTGSGKSFLTYSLIDACTAKGIKVVCIDPTGDYQRYLADAVLLSSDASVKAMLNSPDQHVGILETAASGTNPIQQTMKAANSCLDWCKATRPAGDILNPKPRVLVILEEAHLLVPEWNFNPEQTLQKDVNRTAQIVLQARKYGLGFLVVSQRTANVTKSILNQCNTVVSFQAFDETGFDFLKNYMGSFHVRSLPNLKPRHGILVGKASRSRRPVMVHFADQNRVIRNEPASVMPLPPKVAATDHGAPLHEEL